MSFICSSFASDQKDRDEDVSNQQYLQAANPWYTS